MTEPFGPSDVPSMDSPNHQPILAAPNIFSLLNDEIFSLLPIQRVLASGVISRRTCRTLKRTLYEGYPLILDTRPQATQPIDDSLLYICQALPNINHVIIILDMEHFRTPLNDSYSCMIRALTTMRYISCLELRIASLGGEEGIESFLKDLKEMTDDEETEWMLNVDHLIVRPYYQTFGSVMPRREFRQKLSVRLMSYFPGVEELTLEDYLKWDLKRSPSVERLTLVSDCQLDRLSRSICLGQLTSLSIENSSLALSDEDLGDLFDLIHHHRWPLLKELSIAVGPEGQDDPKTAKVVQHAVQTLNSALRSMAVQLSKFSFRILDQNMTLPIGDLGLDVSSFSRLRELSIPLTNSAAFRNVLLTCPSLESLEVTSISHFLATQTESPAGWLHTGVKQLTVKCGPNIAGRYDLRLLSDVYGQESDDWKRKSLITYISVHLLCISNLISAFPNLAKLDMPFTWLKFEPKEKSLTSRSTSSSDLRSPSLSSSSASIDMWPSLYESTLSDNSASRSESDTEIRRKQAVIHLSLPAELNNSIWQLIEAIPDSLISLNLSHAFDPRRVSSIGLILNRLSQLNVLNVVDLGFIHLPPQVDDAAAIVSDIIRLIRVPKTGSGAGMPDSCVMELRMEGPYGVEWREILPLVSLDRPATEEITDLDTTMIIDETSSQSAPDARPPVDASRDPTLTIDGERVRIVWND